MKILMHSTIKINKKITKDIVKKNIKSNIGAIFHQFSLYKTLKRDDNIIEFENFYKKCSKYDEFANYVNNNYDCVVFSLGDVFRRDMLERLNNFIEFTKRLKIKTIVVGVGVKIYYNNDIDSFLSTNNMGDVIKEFVLENLKRTNIIGVRDKNTAIVLDKLGFVENKDYYVCGCPSFFINDDKLRIPENFPSYDENIKIAINRNFNIKGYPNSYIFFQNNLKKHNNYNTFNTFYYEYANIKSKSSSYGGGSCYRLKYSDYIENRYVAFAYILNYLKELSKYELCIGERMHGCSAAIACGVPTLLICVDNRMEGLAEYHKIPYIKITDIKENDTFEDLLNKVGDFKEMHKQHKTNFERYCNFFKMNNIKTKYDF